MKINMDVSDNILPLLNQFLITKAKLEALIPFVINEDDLEDYNQIVKSNYIKLVEELEKKYPSLKINIDDIR